MTVRKGQRTQEDADEFAALMQRHSASLSRLACLLTGEAHAADDLTAEVFLAAWQQWERIRDLEYPLAYLRKMLTNQSIARYRRRVREVRGLERLFGESSGTERDSDTAAVMDVRSALQRIPPRRRACLVLRYGFDLPDREVAAILGITVGSVKSQTFKAAAQFRAEMGDVVVETHLERLVPSRGWLRDGRHAD